MNSPATGCSGSCWPSSRFTARPLAEKKKLEHWKSDNSEILGYARSRQLEFWGQDGDESEDEDIVPPEMLDAVKELDREPYDVPAMITETFRDLNQLAHFTAEARKFEPRHDDKLQKLSRLLKTKELADQKVLIFTEFADTARYLKRQLDQAGIDGVDQVDSGSPGNRADVIQRFSPLLQQSLLAGACGERPHGDPRPHFHRRPVRGPEPPGRIADD